MKEFLTSNGIKMVECEIYNWKIEPIYYGKDTPFGYCIHMGDMAEMYQAFYMPDEKKLSLCSTAYSSDEVFHFHCEDLKEAEIIVHSYIKGNNFDMNGTIYEKLVEPIKKEQ